MPSEIVRAPEHNRARSLGWLGTRWIEHFAVHGPGDIQGTPLDISKPGAIPLSDELTMLTVDSYGLGVDGRRLYDSVFYSRPKGADKSGHAARIALFEAMGPCRFAGWAEGGEVYEWMDFRHVYERGEPMGRPVTYPFIRVMATEEGQTGNVYDVIYYNLTEGPLREAFTRRDDVGLTRVYLPGGGEIRPSTASSAAKDGGKETHVCYDETHLYILPELKRMYATVRRNLAKRKDAEPWSNETSTMYEPGLNSVAEATHDLAKRIEAGKVKRARLLFDHREAPADIDIANEEQLKAGLREAYGDAASYMDLDRLVAEIWDPRNEEQDSIRYFLNRPEQSATAAFDIEQWRRLADTSTYIQPEELITLGFDGSTRWDSTALIATHVDSGFQWPLGIWERPDRVGEWEVPYAEVERAVEAAFELYDVWRMYCDPRWWETRISAWAGKFGADRVVEWATNRNRAMAFSLLAYQNAINAGDLKHNGDAVLEAHIGNAVKHPENIKDENGKPLWTIRKETSQSFRKIDAAMAACLSWEARNDAVASGATSRGGWVVRL